MWLFYITSQADFEVRVKDFILFGFEDKDLNGSNFRGTPSKARLNRNSPPCMRSLDGQSSRFRTLQVVTFLMTLLYH